MVDWSLEVLHNLDLDRVHMENRHSVNMLGLYRWKLTLTPANIGQNFELSTRLHGSSSENWALGLLGLLYGHITHSMLNRGTHKNTTFDKSQI